jgi:hypothetical protein
MTRLGIRSEFADVMVGDYILSTASPLMFRFYFNLRSGSFPEQEVLRLMSRYLAAGRHKIPQHNSGSSRQLETGFL